MISEQSPTDLVRATARYISSNPNSAVKVDEEACRKAASFLYDLVNQRPHTCASVSQSWCFANGLHPYNPSPNALNWIFVVDTLNFCFWTPRGCTPFTVEYKKNSYTGYWALCAAINRALDDNIPITDPSFYATVTAEVMEYIFRSSTPTAVPLLAERLQALNEAGTVLRDKFNSSVETLVLGARGSAQNLVKLVVSNFTSFADAVPTAKYIVEEAGELDESPPGLYFYKRAQILVADIWACFASTKKYCFHDIQALTMFADYRVPQTLAWLGAIRYSDTLMKELRSGAEIAPGSSSELEIRGCSIQAVEVIRGFLEAKYKPGQSDDVVPINAVLIDYLLWDYAKAHASELSNIPVHHVRCIYY